MVFHLARCRKSTVQQLCQFSVFVGYGIACIVGGKVHGNFIVNIAPFGVVVQCAYAACGQLHKGHGLFKGGERVCFMQGVVFFFPVFHGCCVKPVQGKQASIIFATPDLVVQRIE